VESGGIGMNVCACVCVCERKEKLKHTKKWRKYGIGLSSSGQKGINFDIIHNEKERNRAEKREIKEK